MTSIPQAIVRVFGSLFGGLGRVGWFVIGRRFARRSLIMILILVAFLRTPIIDSIDQGTPKPVIDTIVTKLGSGDNGINQETNDLKALEKRTFWDLGKTLLKILGLFYLSFYLIGWFFWKLADWQNESMDARNIIFAVIMVFLLQLTGSIYLLADDHQGGFIEDANYIIGEKSLLDTVKFLNPIKGIINFARNIDLFLEPIATTIDTFYFKNG